MLILVLCNETESDWLSRELKTSLQNDGTNTLSSCNTNTITDKDCLPSEVCWHQQLIMLHREAWVTSCDIENVADNSSHAIFHTPFNEVWGNLCRCSQFRRTSRGKLEQSPPSIKGRRSKHIEWPAVGTCDEVEGLFPQTASVFVSR